MRDSLLHVASLLLLALALPGARTLEDQSDADKSSSLPAQQKATLQRRRVSGSKVRVSSAFPEVDPDPDPQNKKVIAVLFTRQDGAGSPGDVSLGIVKRSKVAAKSGRMSQQVHANAKISSNPARSIARSKSGNGSGTSNKNTPIKLAAPAQMRSGESPMGKGLSRSRKSVKGATKMLCRRAGGEEGASDSCTRPEQHRGPRTTPFAGDQVNVNMVPQPHLQEMARHQQDVPLQMSSSGKMLINNEPLNLGPGKITKTASGHLKFEPQLTLSQSGKLKHGDNYLAAPEERIVRTDSGHVRAEVGIPQGEVVVPLPPLERTWGAKFKQAARPCFEAVCFSGLLYNQVLQNSGKFFPDGPSGIGKARASASWAGSGTLAAFAADSAGRTANALYPDKWWPRQKVHQD